MAVIILVLGLWLTRVFSKWLRTILEKKKIDPSLRYFLQNLLVIILQILVVFLSLQVAGIQLSFFTAILAGLTVAGGLALSGTLQNFVSGLLILLLRPYKVNDIVIIQGQQGTVTSIQLFYTLVLTPDNQTIIVPNGQLSNNVVTNLSKEGKRRIEVALKFQYKTDINKIREAINIALKGMEGLFNDPALRVGITALEPDRFSVSVQVWTAAHGFEDAKMRLQEKILVILIAEGLLPA